MCSVSVAIRSEKPGCALGSVRYGGVVSTGTRCLTFVAALAAWGLGAACVDGEGSATACNADEDCAPTERCTQGVCAERTGWPTSDAGADADAGALLVDAGGVDAGPLEDGGTPIVLPPEWTCEDAVYDEAARGDPSVGCDCGCGAPDPDCDVEGALPAGCLVEGGLLCVEAACVPDPCGDGELAADEGCDDGNDDDGDGCAGCVVTSGFSCDDAPSVCAPECGDGQVVGDELCDGDAASVTCADLGPFVNGAIACGDGCFVVEGSSCAPPATCGGGDVGELTGVIASGDMVGEGDEWRTPAWAGCGDIPGGAEDTSLFWTAPETKRYRFITEGSTFDTVLMILDGCSTDVVACSDDVGDGDLSSAIELDVEVGTRLLIVVDGYDASQSGTYSLAVDSVVQP